METIWRWLSETTWSQLIVVYLGYEEEGVPMGQCTFGSHETRY